ncbi:heavy metal-associated isoprenylated plant protein 29 [Ipomoea triloba]|uniref:heavy metal-associated isoprenylated plant protein 29 n=1 Tax=Ipomoea triloba TaxID=35885 RepID=UPI00125DB320|nr:heavy metal-associated isoprenylated plant protein 29 [Ipomoea triloba]
MMGRNMTAIVEMRVHMDCPGCESKIKKALKKLDGVDEVDIEMEKQKVTVTGWADQMKVVKTVRKTGRKAELWPYPYNPEYHSFAHRYYNFYCNPSTHFSKPYSYNYHKHGYNGHDHGYYQEAPYSTIIDEQTSKMFSDENATGCSIM